MTVTFIFVCRKRNDCKADLQASQTAAVSKRYYANSGVHHIFFTASQPDSKILGTQE